MVLFSSLEEERVMWRASYCRGGWVMNKILYEDGLVSMRCNALAIDLQEPSSEIDQRGKDEGKNCLKIILPIL